MTPLALRETIDAREAPLRQQLGAMLENGTMTAHEIRMANVICRMLYGSEFQWTEYIQGVPPDEQAARIREIVHGGGEGRLLTHFIAKDMGGLYRMFPVLRVPGDNTLHITLEQFKIYNDDPDATLPAGITVVEPSKTTHWHVEEMSDEAFDAICEQYANAEVALASAYWMLEGNKRMRYL